MKRVALVVRGVIKVTSGPGVNNQALTMNCALIKECSWNILYNTCCTSLELLELIRNKYLLYLLGIINTVDKTDGNINIYQRKKQICKDKNNTTNTESPCWLNDFSCLINLWVWGICFLSKLI